MVSRIGPRSRRLKTEFPGRTRTPDSFVGEDYGCGSTIAERNGLLVFRWNPDVALALQQDELGLHTGQSAVDGILAAMDAAWQQGPS
jgi:hypothetical protein